jgi:transposase-like protein
MEHPAAAREVGVSRTTGNNWSRGYKTCRHGQVVRFVPALERLAVCQISARFLSQDERIEIADLRHAGLSIRQIAHQLGRAPSTISRELHRNATAGRGYRPFEAHRRATARRARSHRRRIETNAELGQLVAELLAAVEPAADQPSPAAEVPRPARDVAMSREHLPGRLSARIGAVAPVAAGSAPPFTAAHRA